MSRFTPSQAAAVAHDRGGALVLAGAGAGKTAVIIARVSRLIRTGVAPPHAVQMVTFSRKAAGEMRERLAADLGSERADRVAIDTFHAWGYRLIRSSPPLFGFDGTPTVMTDRDQERLWRRSIGEGRRAPEKSVVRAALDRYSMLKNEGVTAADAGERPRLTEAFAMVAPGLGTALREGAARYEAGKQRQRLLDYDDLCLLPARVLAADPAFAARIAERSPWWTVDEAQDTNLVQYRMLHAVCRHHGNVVLVGDDDQSIYGWRGARVENLQSFIDDFEPAIHRLEANFRSTHAIVDSARRHIEHNIGRLPKTPVAVEPGGDPVRCLIHGDGHLMADGIATAATAAIGAGRSVAVLYRTNAMATVIEPALRRAGLAYRLVGGVGFWERPEIRICTAAARLSANPLDGAALAVLARYVRGLGEKSVDALASALHRCDADWWQAIAALPPGTRPRATMLMDAVNRFVAGAADPDALVRWAAERGVMKDMDPQRRKDACARLEEAARAVSRDGLECLVEAPLNDPDVDPDTGSSAPMVTLSTIHRAKGLEWDEVHVAGASEGLLPHSSGEPDEERRLSYVALTRARRRCVFHHAKMLRIHGADRFYDASSFLAEMGVTPEEDPNLHGPRRGGPGFLAGPRNGDGGAMARLDAMLG